MYHFGYADTKGRAGIVPGVDFIARGGMMLLAAKCQPEAVSWIVAQLIEGSPASTVSILSTLTTLHLVCLVPSTVIHMLKCHKAAHMEILVEQLLLISIFAFLPPLVAFSLYFNGTYAPRMLLVASQLSAVKSSLTHLWQRKQTNALHDCTVMVFMITLLTLVLFLRMPIGKTKFDGKGDASIGAILKVAFVLLSAVSTPNMFLMSMRLSKSSLTDDKDKVHDLTMDHDV